MKLFMTIVALFLSTALGFGQSPPRNNASIAPVTGESWLHHLHRSFDETRMGKTWRLGSGDISADQFDQLGLLTRSGSRTHRNQIQAVRGSDLYRMNCQGCHGEFGLGAPPEIGSLIDPVRATSAALIEQRMKKIGMAFSRQQTAEMASQAKSALLQRLHEGGRDMPSFHHLNEAEIKSLVAYLTLLARVPGSQNKQSTIQESNVRIGELIVKSTCHICHGATGINPTPADLMEGAVPPLSALPMRVNQVQLVRKVTSGAPIIMGTTSLAYRGRMPVFDYLTEDEAADVYEYITRYPPVESTEIYQTAQGASPEPSVRHGAHEDGAIASQPVPPRVRILRERKRAFVLATAMGSFVVACLVLECWITLREFKRLSIQSSLSSPSRHRKATHTLVTTIAPVEMIMASSNACTECMDLEPTNWPEARKIS
jgi:mono/diheme cytochrome c family protein